VLKSILWDNSMYNFNNLKPEYTHLWEICKINPGKQKQFKEAAELIKKGEIVYKELEAKTGVPWYLIGMLHYRESDCNFHTHLHNGDSLRYRTQHVPAGRPPVGNPPFSFEYSAIDALKYEGFDKIHDWSIERVLYCLEQYNGWGYRQRGFPSAYVWAGTNDYVHGKFVSDGVFSAYVVDSQLGCAGILKDLLSSNELDIQLDSSSMDDYRKTNKAKLSPEGADNLQQTSRKWNLTNWLHGIFGTGAVVGGVSEGLDASKIQSAKSTLDAGKVFINDYGIFIFIGVCVFGSVLVYLIRKYMVEDATSGRYLPSGEVSTTDRNSTNVVQNVG
jgi:lysozyme family protein